MINNLLSNERVNSFLENLDDIGKQKFRHTPDMENEFQYFAMVEINGNLQGLVGYGAVYPRNPKSKVAGLAVVLSEKYRGIGLGKIMYKAGEELAMKYGKDYFRAETDADNEPAVAVMASLGWEINGPIYVVKKFFDKDEVQIPCPPYPDQKLLMDM